SSVKITSSSLDGLQGAEHVEHAGALEVAFAAEIGGARAQDALDPGRIADEFLGTGHEQGRRTADVRSGHARSVEALGGGVRRQRDDLLAGSDEIRLEAAVSCRAAAGEVRDPVAEWPGPVRAADGDHLLGIAGIGDADTAESLVDFSAECFVFGVPLI